MSSPLPRDTSVPPRYEDFCEWEHGDLARVLAEVAASGVSFEDPRVGYVEVQIDRKTWEAVRHG